MPVKIICHRGWWKTPEEQNTLAAFARAFSAGIGVELDVRDALGELVVSHDPPQLVGLNTDGKTATISQTAPLFSEVLKLLDDYGNKPFPLAVNVKSCGLAPWFAQIERKPAHWFFFDVAPGDEIEYPKNNLPLYKRDTWNADPVLLVSWEILFGEDPKKYWANIRDRGNEGVNILLITDRPAEAMEFFK